MDYDLSHSLYPSGRGCGTTWTPGTTKFMPAKIIKPTPSQQRMILSDASVSVLIGPQGEGKTFGAVGKILHHAQQFPYKIRGAIIRDRFTNIQTNTIPSINKVCGEIVTFHNDGRLMRAPNIDLDLFGVEDLADMNRLQGSEYYIVWIEEPAPYFQSSVGIREEVFDICYSRGGREEGAVSVIVVTMNPASKSHWTYKRFILNPMPDMEVIRIPYGENPHLSQKERGRAMETWKNKPDMYARYVKGEFASVHIGEEVVSEFREARGEGTICHVSKGPLVPAECLTFRLWDGWLNPTCVFIQVTPGGQVLILQTVRGENIGMKQLIEQQVKPLIATKYHKIQEWRDIGDLHLRDKDQSDSTKSAAEVVERSLNTYFEDGDMSWESRRETLKEAFNMTVDGEPKILVSCDDDIMIEALGGGWHYPKSPSGIVGDKPVKDIHSHPGDALSHGLAMILHPSGNDRKRYDSYDTEYDPFREGRLHEVGGDDWDPFNEVKYAS